jgi:hypothetical protein
MGVDYRLIQRTFAVERDRLSQERLGKCLISRQLTLQPQPVRFGLGSRIHSRDKRGRAVEM